MVYKVTIDTKWMLLFFLFLTVRLLAGNDTSDEMLSEDGLKNDAILL